MDIPAYISSGILENYALGLTNESESKQVEAMAKDFPAIKIELNKINDALGKLSVLYQKTPPAALRNQIIKNATSAEPSPKFEPKIIPVKTKPQVVYSHSNTGLKISVVALIVLLAGSAAYNYIQFDEMSVVKKSLQKTQEENTTLTEKINSQTEELDIMHQSMSLMTKPGNKMIELKGTDKAPAASAVIFYNQNTSEVFMGSVNLPDAPAGKQYQLWAYVGGIPVDLGVMNLRDNPNEIHAMKNVTNAESFTVTLEKQGGSTSPVATEIYLSNKGL